MAFEKWPLDYRNKADFQAENEDLQLKF